MKRTPATVRRRAMMILIQWILGLLIAVVFLKVLVLWLQPRMAFYPVPGPTPPPAPLVRFQVQTADHLTLVGWRTDIPDSGPVVLYFCGNAGNLNDRISLLSRFALEGGRIVAFNYRGTGESGGRPSEVGLYRDATAVYEYLVESQNVEPSRIVLWGHSIGGAVACNLASRRLCAGLVLQSTFRSGKIMARRMIPLLPLHWFTTYRFDNESLITTVNAPKLFIHGTDDRVVPIVDSERLYEIAPDPKDIWRVAGAGHNDIQDVAGGRFHQRIGEFAARCVGDSHNVQVSDP